MGASGVWGEVGPSDTLVCTVLVPQKSLKRGCVWSLISKVTAMPTSLLSRVKPIKKAFEKFHHIYCTVHVDIHIYYTVFTRSINALKDSDLSLCLPSDYSTRNVDSGEMSWLMSLLRVFPA